MDARAAVKGFQFVSLTQELLDKALSSALPDFEDNIQLVSAEKIVADYVVTRNKKHFQSASLSILAPEEWLALDAVVQIEIKTEPSMGD
jgi:hypothetical protein